ncbi:MAG TPA: thioredoxin reductase [Planctomycetaceae bacterium]|nr:thioredoxin reductase [Planctomycetaceae bacterium]
MIQDIAFNKFDDTQMSAITRIGERVEFTANEVMIAGGQKDYPFFVVQTGEIDIYEADGDHSTLIATHGPREFSGDVDMLTGRSTIFTAIARSDGVAYRLCAVRLRRLLAECPRVSETLLNAFQTRREMLADLPITGVRVIGEVDTVEVGRLREFLYKNHVPHSFYDSVSQSGIEQLEQLGASQLELPVVRCNGKTIGNPALERLAECIGINRKVDGQHFDLVVVGSGPAGLAAAVYAASEGIDVLVVDSVGPGGQAGSSSKIENFIGFPSGLSGSQLAERGYLQALKFGAKFVAPVTVQAIETDAAGVHRLTLSGNQAITARCVLVATGVSYRQLDLPGCSRFEGAGVYYAATSVEARVCENSTAVVVGGGNSAGQAAMYLAEHAGAVKLLIRGDDLRKSMSEYLCGRIENHPNIELLKHTEVAEILGEKSVRSVRLVNNQTGEAQQIECAGLFIFIGARPHTDWLPDEVLLDEKGFVLTGSSFMVNEELRSRWQKDRPPCDLESTVPGVMACGDVRSGTTKRCGFAVGDGSLAVACVHRFLGEQ